MFKYAVLQDHLGGMDCDRWSVSFGEVEAVLGFPLPRSAREHQAWWANQTTGGHSQTKAWTDAGWRTAKLDLKGARVTFVRSTVPARYAVPQSPRQESVMSRVFEQAASSDHDALIEEAMTVLVEREAASAWQCCSRPPG